MEIRLRPGQLVLDADGYYAVVVEDTSPPLPDGTRAATVELFLANGLRVVIPSDQVRQLGLRQGDGPDPPATFHELLSGRGLKQPHREQEITPETHA